MTRVQQFHLVDAEGLEVLRRPRTDLLLETPLADDEWGLGVGPFRAYRRSLDVTLRPDGRYEVAERTEFTMSLPIWWPLIQPLMRRALRSANRIPRTRWWWPREVVTRRTGQLVAALCVISVMAGYLGVVIGQTITFAAADFGNSDSAQANTLAGVRVGVLLSLMLIHRADRVGRRPLIIGFSAAAIGFTMMGALAPNLVVLGATQTLARGLTTGLITLIVLATTEEVPAGSRAFSISLITVSAALGAGMVVWVLPLAGLFQGGWRVVYLVPGLFLPLLWWVAKRLPETRRFDAAAAHGAPATIHWYRFALIGFAAFAASFYLSPASQLRNEFLRDDLGYSAGTISLFQLVISTPAGLSIIVAGMLADRIGRRLVGAVGLAGGAALSALSYQLQGPWLWVVACAGMVLAGASFPATRGYQTELFPTRSRARVGGLLDVVGVAGSASGLVLAGYLSQRWDNLGSAIGVLVFAPMLVAVAILVLFPETAAVELEEFNPHDPEMAPVVSDPDHVPNVPNVPDVPDVPATAEP